MSTLRLLPVEHKHLIAEAGYGVSDLLPLPAQAAGAHHVSPRVSAISSAESERRSSNGRPRPLLSSSIWKHHSAHSGSAWRCIQSSASRNQPVCSREKHRLAPAASRLRGGHMTMAPAMSALS